MFGHIENLESRRMLSANLSSAGLLSIRGLESAANTISVALDGDNVVVTDNGTVTNFQKSLVKRLRITGGRLADTINVAEAFTLKTVIKTFAGNDIVNSGNGNDHIDVGAGNDTVNARGGRNVVLGGEGDDNITTGAGNDRVHGGAGNDVINLGNGENVARGDLGNDLITGGENADRLHGGKGNDTLIGGAGNDILIGAAGDDRLEGGSGSNQFWGFSGVNTMIATPGAGDVNTYRTNSRNIIDPAPRAGIDIVITRPTTEPTDPENSLFSEQAIEV
jgi:Ca2+-binding RTX toxin-like protein